MTEWVVDEFGNRTWAHQGWRLRVWANGSVDCEGPEGEDIDHHAGNLIVRHDAPYDGSVSVMIPIAVIAEYMAAVEDRDAD